jgi:hypothetical protein
MVTVIKSSRLTISYDLTAREHGQGSSKIRAWRVDIDQLRIFIAQCQIFGSHAVVKSDANIIGYHTAAIICSE